MKWVFDWLREQIDKKSFNGISENGAFVTSFIHSKIAKLCIDEAEAKWVADCCEWHEGEDDMDEGIFETSCGKMNCLMGGTLTENGYRYCPYCGRKISEVE